MFLHLGGTAVISLDEIIAVINLENISLAEEWIARSLTEEKVLHVSDGEPKSAILPIKNYSFTDIIPDAKEKTEAGIN